MADRAFGVEHALSTTPTPCKTRRVSLSEKQDGPVLKLIRNATFISRKQIILLSQCLGLSVNNQNIDWRLGRYVDIGLVNNVGRVYPHGGAVYTISRSGLSVLEAYGEGLASVTSESERLADPIQAAHFLEINEVRISIMTSPAVTIEKWYTDREVSSMNYTLERPFAKDYDAIIKLRNGTRPPIQFGFEYERTYKALERYKEMAAGISGEKQLKFVLYVTASPDMVFKIAPLMDCRPVPVCFTPSNLLRQDGFAANVAFLLNTQVKVATLDAFMTALINA
jgi:hypothetical protein